MLIMFRAKNYRCFHDEVILDMRASGLREHPSHYMALDNIKVLKTQAIYGPNASGKSTIVNAMRHYEDFILQNMFLEDKNENDLMYEDNVSKAIVPFALKETTDTNVEMEMIFFTNNKYYQYGFELDSITGDIASEWLLVDDDEIFEISENTIKTGSKYKNELKDLPRKRKDRLYLSVLDYFADDELGDIVKEIKFYFSQKLFFALDDYGSWGMRFFRNSVSVSKRLVNDESFRKKVVDCVHDIDVGIVDIEIEVRVSRNPRTGEEIKRPVIKTVHSVYDEHGKIVGRKSFELQNESTGTLKFLFMIQILLGILEKGGTFVIDELSKGYHPMLTRHIINLFQSEENKAGAQLIFTSHDISLLNNSQFRRDEVSLIEKDNQGMSRLFSLSDLKVRADASFSKDYFNGRYGAIPMIKQS